MERQLVWAAGKPGVEDLLLSTHSDTEAYYGQLGKARDFSLRAVNSAVRADSRETAALWLVNAALREAELGNTASAKQRVTAALALCPGRDVKVAAALALARVGDPLGSDTRRPEKALSLRHVKKAIQSPTRGRGRTSLAATMRRPFVSFRHWLKCPSCGTQSFKLYRPPGSSVLPAAACWTPWQPWIMLHQSPDLHRSKEFVMQIGEPLRTIIVEPLELPANEPTTEPELEPQQPQPEPEPAPV